MAYQGAQKVQKVMVQPIVSFMSAGRKYLLFRRKLDWTEKNTIDIILPFAEDWKRSFSTVHTAPNNTI